MKKWNLDLLYTSFDDPKIAKDLTRLEQLITDYTLFTTDTLASDLSIKDKLLNYYKLLNECIALFDVLGNMGHLSYSVDTKNTDALKLIEKLESLEPELALGDVRFKKWLKDIDDLETLVKNDEELSVYSFVILSAKESSKYMLSDKEESLIAQMKNTGSNAWGKLQDIAISSLTAKYDDEVLPITIIRSYAYDPDATKRKKAYEAEIKALGSIAPISASVLNAIKGEVITECGLRGYESPLEMTLKASRMDKETLDAMMSAIKEYLPVFRAYLKKKANLLGYDGGLPFYELFAPIGEINMTYSYDEARDFVVNNFSSYSEKLGKFAKNAFDNDWIDPFPREGKVAGAFCSNIHSKKESRIMSNFNGSFNDMSTLAHELGHGYHGDCLSDAKDVNSDYPMPLAETASIFCETIITNAALETATKEEKLVILENAVMSATQVIVDIYSRYLFETALFEGRKEASLSVEELNELMLNAQKEAYGDGLDHRSLHPYMWVVKPHYYSAGYNFYNFPYAFGQLFATGLYAKYLDEKEGFLEKYDNLLLSTGHNNIKDVLATVGVDSHNPDFFKNSLELIKGQVDFILNY